MFVKNMQKLTKRLPKFRSRSQKLKLLVLLLLGSYFIYLLTAHLKCTAGYRNLKKRISKHLYTPEDVSCYHEEHPDDLNSVKKDSLYLISASCDSSISIHHACAIESMLALHYHNASQVYVFVTKPVKYCLCSSYMISLLVGKGIHFVTIQIDEFVEDTPLKDVFKGEFLKTGIRQEARVAEYLKFAALYKFGGVIIDLDLIVRHPVWHTPGSSCFGVRINSTHFGSAAVGLNQKSLFAKTLLLNTMELLKKQRNRDVVDGGLALTEALGNLCGNQPDKNCSQFRIYQPNRFYPYNRSSNHMWFRGGYLPQPEPYGCYVWEQTEISIFSYSVYANLLREVCTHTATVMMSLHRYF